MRTIITVINHDLDALKEIQILEDDGWRVDVITLHKSSRAETHHHYHMVKDGRMLGVDYIGEILERMEKALWEISRRP